MAKGQSEFFPPARNNSKSPSSLQKTVAQNLPNGAGDALSCCPALMRDWQNQPARADSMPLAEGIAQHIANL
jgi:hypothetical protein